MNLLKDTEDTRRHWGRSNICICYLWAEFIPCSGASTINFEQVNAHWNYDHSRDFSYCFTQSCLQKIVGNIFMELLMLNKEKVMDNYLFHLKFALSKVGLKIGMSYCIDFLYSLHFRDDFHPLRHLRIFKWWGFLVSFTFVSFSVRSFRPQKAIYHQFIIKNNVLIKVFQRNQ